MTLASATVARRLSVPTANYHHWNSAEISAIKFAEVGLQRLTFRYGKGNNFAYFEGEPVLAHPAIDSRWSEHLSHPASAA